MGRLSTFAKNRILNLRFQKSFRIKQIATALLQEDNIKVSRKSISTFLKKYIETKSINDKPRSGRNKKLTPEEINLIGEVTRLNRDITAPKIKEYLNLNVSTYTILRASKLFEWNKLNPNSNEAKKAAALERQLNGEARKKRGGGGGSGSSSKKRSSSSSGARAAVNISSDLSESSLINDFTAACSSKSACSVTATNSSLNLSNKLEEPMSEFNLNLIPDSEVQLSKNVSSSPMVFATKILYKIFELNELIGHNVSGKTFNKYIKNKKALDEKRVNYIRYLVEKHFDNSNREELWKSCRTAINKSIRNNEIKYAASIGLSPNNVIIFQHKDEQIDFNNSISENLTNGDNNDLIMTTTNNNNNCNNPNNNHNSAATDFGGIVVVDASMSKSGNEIQVAAATGGEPTQLISLQPNMSIFQITNDLSPGCADEANKLTRLSFQPTSTSIVKLTDTPPDLAADFITTRETTTKVYIDLNKQIKLDNQEEEEDEEEGEMETHEIELDGLVHLTGSDSNNKLHHLLSESEINEMKSQCCCSPMIFATKVLLKIFTKDELVGHNVSGKTFHKNLKNKKPLDEARIGYIKSLVEACFPNKKIDIMWKSCRKAINRVIRNFEIKESKLNKSIDDLNEIDFLLFKK